MTKQEKIKQTKEAIKAFIIISSLVGAVYAVEEIGNAIYNLIWGIQ